MAQQWGLSEALAVPREQGAEREDVRPQKLGRAARVEPGPQPLSRGLCLDALVLGGVGRGINKELGQLLRCGAAARAMPTGRASE